VLLWTNVLYAKWKAWSIGDMPHGDRAMTTELQRLYGNSCSVR
jgi:hypothetical protein